jgi:AcrR family transcriptional regulator
MFSQQGYENVTLRAIAEALGYTHATLYRYFPDKARLLADICRDTFERLIVELDGIAASARDPRERLLQTSRGFIWFGLKHPQHFRIVFFGPEERNGRRAGDYIHEIGKPMFDRLIDVFQECSHSSGLDNADLIVDAHTWWASIFGLTQVLIAQGRLPNVPPPERVVERTLLIMWTGLKALSTEIPVTPAAPVRPRSLVQ